MVCSESPHLTDQAVRIAKALGLLVCISLVDLRSLTRSLKTFSFSFLRARILFPLHCCTPPLVTFRCEQEHSSFSSLSSPFREDFLFGFLLFQLAVDTLPPRGDMNSVRRSDLPLDELRFCVFCSRVHRHQACMTASAMQQRALCSLLRLAHPLFSGGS